MPTVLVTGAARGIGATIVVHLAAAGWSIVAGVRSDADGAAIAERHPHNVTPVLLDVTDPEHLAALPDALPERLDAVVNNAGIVVAGPIETVTPQDWRKQLDINVIGQLAVTRAVLPHLRSSGGRVVFISSVSGRLSTPLMGPYCASKAALESAADALRVELRTWGIPVVLVEPAQTDTDMWRTAESTADDAEAAMTPEQRALYARHIAGLRKGIPTARKMAVPPEKVAAVVETALTARRPRARYVVGVAPKLQVTLMSMLPTRIRDVVIETIMGVPRRA